MFNLDYQSKMPIYEQIVNIVEKYVALGVFKPKEQMPSIRDLAASLSVNPNTVKKAYDELEKREIIITISTKGTFITDNVKKVINKKIDKSIEEINRLINELERFGITRKDIIKRLN